ncbi:beta-galactosidase trimerization domain-containing protein [bacterium]|nr:beta-galactosidase trimerization domain-containing protein [bacterium]
MKHSTMLLRVVAAGLFLLGLQHAPAATVYVDATKFAVTGDGWKVETNLIARQTTWVRALHGAGGAFDSTANGTATVPEPGRYRVWVRYLQSLQHRGPFRVALATAGSEIAANDFDTTRKEEGVNLDYVWDSFEADLPAGPATVTISKAAKDTPDNYYTRAIDCLLLTTDLEAKPDNTLYGPQLYLRVTVGEGHEKPFYIHIFANYYRGPWYGHYALTRDELTATVQPVTANPSLFSDGDRSGWLNVTPLMYFDSGVNLTLSARYAYSQAAPRLNARFEIASAPEDGAVVKTIERDAWGSFRIIIPPDFARPEGADKFCTDLELAERYGKIADAMQWPTVGKPPERFPFFVVANLPTVPEQTHPYVPPVDRKTFDREWKTLGYFGYVNLRKTALHSTTWNTGVGTNYSCYTGVNRDAIRKAAQREADEFRATGKPLDNIAYAMTMDEPHGAPVEHVVTCPICGNAFRDWLRGLGVIPAELGVADWDAVQPVDDKQKVSAPALFYWTQRFRTRALSQFLRWQREALTEAYGADFPVNVNFSDGIVYVANIGCVGVDYFDLLASDDQNSLWSEDWANGSSTRQCTAYNSELMRSAARGPGQVLGQYLIGYSYRKPWAMKIYTASHAARDHKILNAYWYGPVWSAHEAGPPWQNHSIQARTESWYGNAEIVREIGGAEDLLYPAKKRQSEIAILYSSSADIWEMGWNYAYGFERMHTWLALAHRQIPVDFLSEQDVAEGSLKDYKVCYLAGTRLTRAAAAQLPQWVRRGGTLVLTAGAATRDEYNRPLAALDSIRPATLGELEEPGRYLNSGRYLDTLAVVDRVTLAEGGATLDVLSVKQALTPKGQAEVLGTFGDGSAAVVRGKAGRGTVYTEGFLPGIAYIRRALIARNELLEKAKAAGTLEDPIPDPAAVIPDEAILRRSGEPWQYPAEYREFVVAPALAANPKLPVECSVPLVDAVVMDSEAGSVVVLANYTLQPLAEVMLTVETLKPARRVESVHRGPIKFRKVGRNRISLMLPLQETDFVKVYTATRRGK